MRLLLDTHTLIWFTEGIKLPENIRKVLESDDNEKFVSVVSLWEIAIKSSNGKLDLKKSFAEINKFLAINEIQIVGITTEHLKAIYHLPKFENHKDPFDRLLIAQAISENLTIVSADRHFASYPVEVIW